MHFFFLFSQELAVNVIQFCSFVKNAVINGILQPSCPRYYMRYFSSWAFLFSNNCKVYKKVCEYMLHCFSLAAKVMLKGNLSDCYLSRFFPEVGRSYCYPFFIMM
jgi:hypothetical protein